MARFNFYLGAGTSALLLAIMVIAAELVGSFKTILKTTFTHHWIGKLVIITLAFIAIGLLYKDKNSIGRFSDESIGWYSVIGSIVLIFLFFIVEFIA